ncbi:GntR family transcriptional regulator [Celeribacter sp.]|uniref:GntR family transcriptional regulator n=1 Tax=Celeribacter sp. TaxID=1890673 RepID=UPI003A8F7659
MPDQDTTLEARSSVERIVDFLYAEITSMRMLPGTRISETDIARKFGVSRQPVREAFTHLARMDLILVRPRRATEVKKLSIRAIEKSRFVRAAVEAAALREAAKHCDAALGYQLDAALALQKKALVEGDQNLFKQLDYDFHKMICEIGRVPYAFEVVRAEKEKVDRLCVMELAKENRMPLLIEDHEKIAAAIKAGDAEGAVAAGMVHLSRLDEIITTIRINNAAFFDDTE